MLTAQRAEDQLSSSLVTPAPRVPVLGAFPWLLRWWVALCALGAASLVGARALHYLSLPLPDGVDRLLDRLMQAGLHTMFLTFLLWLAELPGRLYVFLGGLVALVTRPRWFVRREDGRWATRPWLFALIFTSLALGNVGFDVNPWVAIGCAVSAGLALAGGRLYSPTLAAVVVMLYLAAWAAASPTPTDAVGVGVWAGILALLALLRRWWLAARDVFCLGVFLAAIAQIAASVAPLRWPGHGGALLGAGMAYGFCEDGRRGRLYAAVPGNWGFRFRDGCIIEYDAAGLAKLRDMTLFGPEFSGRLMQLLCLPETIQAAMANTWLSDRIQPENVLEFRIDDPRDVNRSLWGPAMGQQLLWDEKRDAVFYSSEWSNRIYRLDRRTGTKNPWVRVVQARPTWLFIKTINGSLAMAPTPHRARDTFYVGHWLTGSTVYEIDLGRLSLRRQFEPRNGCVADLAIDEQYDRLFATSLWGVDVIDLRTGRVERRIRTGTGARTPAIDTQNGLVYVATTVEGRLRAFDRATLRPVGVLPIGSGARRAFFQASGGRLLATNEIAHFWWDAAALAARLRSD